jgi:hypothetical protein
MSGMGIRKQKSEGDCGDAADHVNGLSQDIHLNALPGIVLHFCLLTSDF